MSLYNDASLVLIPSGYKEGKLYSIKPTDGGGDFTFSRASSATRVNSSGLIEKETQNLLLQSNQFDTTWLISGTISATSGQSGYDGSSDAWLLTKSTASAYTYQNVSSGLRTISVYAKAGSSNWLYILKAANSGQYFNLASGVLGGSAGVSPIDANITSVGGGWYRCSLTYIDAFAGSLRIYPADGDGDVSGTSGSIYIQDAQLEYGLVARDYLETTTTAVYGGITDDLPRLDYTDASCPSLLVEPQRTNNILNSEYRQGNDSADIRLTTTSNATISPEGVQNASYLKEDTSANTHIHSVGSQSWVSGTTYTISMYVKRNGRDLEFGAGNPAVIQFTTIFDLDNGVVLSTLADSASINDVGNGWYRVSVTATALSSASTNINMYLYNGGNNYTGDGVSGIYVWGVQNEPSASYPSSYIPTYGSAVTRVDDACTNFTFNDLQTTDASIFVEFNYTTGKTGNFRFVFNTENSTTGSLDAIQLNSTSGGTSFSFAITGSGVSFSTLSLLSGTNKALIKFERSSGAVKTFLNGTEVDSGTASSIPEIHKISLGARINPFASFNTDREFGDTIKQFLAFPTALTDSECIALTTL